ncbi:MAG: DNA/RNA nuclease SfsA [Eubacterium sp.]|nr:DNA/RNA nuclease SfsA [Eubacterium sp.]MDD7210429.1 DNA/RNA nuclease SfsA [Lachnospiraceae bacterium]MDY5498068.1 DNA/RNA nuclease SfsA [Anaerobutyricum sp.]
MKYKRLMEAVFVKRINRFTAIALVDGREELCHVKNTGRLRELLFPGVEVLLEPSDNPNRKTKYSLICVRQEEQWVNIDSQAPNALVEEWIKDGYFWEKVTLVKREKVFKDSRFDFYLETDQNKWLMEVKGVTLSVGDTALFPDAPTLRGLKHVKELTGAMKEGYCTAVFFVIQKKGVRQFRPNEKRQPEFATALRKAKEAGVKLFAADCLVDREKIKIDGEIQIIL